LSNAKLKQIKADNNTVKHCCNKMLAEWLNIDTKASWKKLFTAIESPAVTSNPAPDNSNDMAICMYIYYSNVITSYVAIYAKQVAIACIL